MPSEPNWSRDISNTSVCTWFYAVAIINATLAVAGVLVALLNKKAPVGVILYFLVFGSFSFFNAWFLFVVCSRGLHEGFKSRHAEHSLRQNKRGH